MVLNTHAVILKLSSATLLLELEITTETKLPEKKNTKAVTGVIRFQKVPY